MKPADSYLRFVKWSDEDQRYISYCDEFPNIMTDGSFFEKAKKATFNAFAVISGYIAEHRNIVQPVYSRDSYFSNTEDLRMTLNPARMII